MPAVVEGGPGERWVIHADTARFVSPAAGTVTWSSSGGNVNRLTRACTFLLALLAASTACTEDVLGPLDGSTFVLRSVRGAPVPITLDTTLAAGFTQRWTVFADTIWLVSNRWARHIVYDERFSDGQVFRRDFEYGGIAQRFNGDLVLVFGKGGQCDCIAPDRVTQQGDELVMRETLFHGGTELIFAPVR